MCKARFNFFNQMLLQCVINCRQNRELEKNQGTTSVDEKEKVEVKLHAAVVLNITDWAIYEPSRQINHLFLKFHHQ